MLKKVMMLLLVSLSLAGTALAHQDDDKFHEVFAHHQTGEGADRQIPDQVLAENWAYRQIAELVEKYAAEKKLPEGKGCSREHLAEGLLGVLDKIVKTYQKDGNRSLLRDDLEAISALLPILEEDLAKQEGYRTIRGTVQEILTLVESEVPEFAYKLGVNGFIRGEFGGNRRLPDSYAPGHNEGRFLYRVKPYAYWHPADYLDFHLEGQGYGYAGSSRFDRYSLYQGFLEARIPDQKWLALKAGRQEFVYGSAFIFGADSAFDGLTYDAARLRLRPTETVTLDFLAGRYATPFSGGVKGNMAAAYLSYAPTEDSALEAYFVRDAGSDDHHAGEYLDSLGMRSTGKYGPLSLEIEPVVQSGKRFNPSTGLDDQTSAYGGHVDLSAEFQPLGYKTKFVVGYAVGSGDKNPARNREFRNPNNDTSLVGDMHLVGDLSGLDVGDHHASGVQVYTLGCGVDITDQLNFSATAHKFVASSVEDGFSRHLGTEGDFTFTYAVNKDFSVILAYDHFFTERFFRDAAGSDKGIDYAYAMLTFNFDKTKKKAPRL